jgi:lipid-binding SYLF domain-containing protein
MNFSFLQTTVLIGAIPLFQAAAQNVETERIHNSIEVLNEVATIPEKTIPEYLFEKAEGVAIIPGVIKGAIGIGGRWGQGIMVVRIPQKGWSDPCFVSLAGGSVGWQIGVESSDLVLIFRTPRSVEGVVNGKIILGADASVAAGPLGRNAEANTDAELKAEILSYARGRGVFLGVSIQGSALEIDNTGNIHFYKNPDIGAKNIFAGNMKNSPAVVSSLKSTLMKLSIGKSVRAGTDKNKTLQTGQPDPSEKEGR